MLLRTPQGTFRPICDFRGNLLALLDESGDIAESYRYDGFGRARVFDGNGTEIAASAVGNPFGFACKRYDPTTALCHFGVRWYDPALGRFISPDPLGFVDGPNRYAYCAGDPVNFIDPWGLCGGPFLPAAVYPGELRNPHSWFAANDLTNNLGSAYVAPGSWLSRELESANARMVTFWLGEHAAQAAMSRALGLLSRVPGFRWLGRLGGGTGAVEARAGQARGAVPRPYLRQGVRDEVLARAPRDAEGRLLDPNTFEVIEGDYHLGHRAGNEWWRIRDRAASEGWTREQLIEYVNDPDLYQIELPANNLSHRFEAPR